MAMKTRAGLLLILLLFISASAQAATARETDSTVGGCGLSAGIRPSSLVSTVSEPITLHVFGEWQDSCTPTYQSHTISGTTVQVNAVWGYPPATVCLPVIAPWGFQIELGQLPAGTYNTELYIEQFGTNLCHTGTFFVFEQVWQDYLPVVYQSE